MNSDEILAKRRAINEAKFRDEVWAMSNFIPTETGLDTKIFVSYKNGARHACRVKVSNIKGAGSIFTNDDSFSIDLDGIVQEGTSDLSSKSMKKLIAWLSLNKEVLKEYWDANGSLGTTFLNNLKKLPTKKDNKKVLDKPS